MRRQHGWLWLLGLALCGASSLAHASAGRFLYVNGAVQIKREGATIPGVRGLPVEPRDEISVGPQGRAQIRMNDGALIALQPSSVFVIDQFNFPSADSGDSGVGSSFLKLLRGGLRTITGLIGKRNGDQYQVGTPVATIGVRGTDYRIALCQADCGETPDGLYLGVSDGSIVVSNGAGQLVLLDNEFAYVPGPNSPPQLLLTPPKVLETVLNEGPGGPGGFEVVVGLGPDEGDCHCSQGDNDPGYRDIVIPGKVMFGEGSRSLAYATSSPAVDGLNAVAAAESTPPASFNAGGALTAFRGLDGDGPTGFRVAGGTISNVGFDPDTGMRWGRWSESAQIGGADVDLTNHDLHWIVGPQAGTLFALATAGSATFDLVGNTNPTDNQGHVGVLGAATLTANFASQTLSNSISLSINDQVWTASGTAALHSPSPLFAGNYSQVNVAGGAQGTGSFAGFFVPPPPGETTPAGAGLSYNLNSGGTTVNGSAAFGHKH